MSWSNTSLSCSAWYKSYPFYLKSEYCPANPQQNLLFFEILKDEPPHKKMALHPMKTQISLGSCPVWSKSSLCTQWVAKDPRFLHADSEDSDQTGRMPRLIRVFTQPTVFVMKWLTCPGHVLIYPLLVLMTILAKAIRKWNTSSPLKQFPEIYICRKISLKNTSNYIKR